MSQTIKCKLIEIWNRFLKSLVIETQNGLPKSTSEQPSYEELSSTLSAIPDLMFELDENGKHWDARVLRPELLVAPTEDLLGRTVSEVMPVEAAQAVMRAIQEAKQNGYSHGTHILLPTPVGELWFEISIARKEVTHADALNEEGLRFIVISRDINQHKLAYLEAEKLAYHDHLTQLPNRYALQKELKEQITKHHKKGNFCALLFLDLDNFKQINDEHGHQAGDQLLKTIAQRLRNSIRSQDRVIRWGGDEFIILINDLSTTRNEAKQLAASISNKIANNVSEPFILDNMKFLCGVSIGIRLFSSAKIDIDKVIEQADAAMYLAKKSNETYIFHQE